MKTQTFKTNMTCSGCVRVATPALNELSANWSVDTSSPDRTLKIETDKPATEVIAQVEKAGFSCVALS
jgi:copper chaperone CopZ